MSEFSHDQDEVASAYLDDAATAEERARVEADPALLARVEQLRSVRDALADPVVPPTPAERDASITAALAVSNVVDLEAVRGQRRLRIASIAAAIVLVLGAAGFLIRAADDSSTEKFTAVAASPGSRADKSAAAGNATAEQAGAGTGAGGSAFSIEGRPDLGSFADRSSLAAAAQGQAHDFEFANGATRAADSAAVPQSGEPSTTAPSGALSPSPAPSCLVPAPSDATGEVYAATAVLEGRSVQVDVYTISDGSLILVVTDVATCAQVFTQPV